MKVSTANSILKTIEYGWPRSRRWSGTIDQWYPRYCARLMQHMASTASQRSTEYETVKPILQHSLVFVLQTRPEHSLNSLNKITQQTIIQTGLTMSSNRRQSSVWINRIRKAGWTANQVQAPYLEDCRVPADRVSKQKPICMINMREEGVKRLSSVVSVWGMILMRSKKKNIEIIWRYR